MKRGFAVLSLLLTIGCGSVYDPFTDAITPQEVHVLSETTRFAQMLHVKVTGALSDYVYSFPCSNDPRQMCIAAGWYDRGVAYYYRPYINRKDTSYGSYVAAHEVCHAKEFIHGVAHDECVISLVGYVSLDFSESIAVE